MKKLFLVIFTMTFFFVSFAKADTIICSDRNIGIAASAFTSRAAAESWFPAYIYISDDQVKFGDGRNSWFNVTSNIGDDYVNAAASISSTLFKFKYRKSKNNLSVKLVQGGSYKPIAPITYKNCEQLGSKSSSSNVSDSAARAAYIKLSKCNRRYIQQFLSGQGLYKSTIDGKWGAGTASALQKAKNLGKLKSKSAAQIIQQLSQNLVCD
jgi:hypothetical protein